MRAYLLVAAVLVLAGYLLCAPLAGRWMLERLASQYPEHTVAACPMADAIAVLAGTGPPRPGPPQPGEKLNRMEAGIALYHAGRAPLLVLAGDGVEVAGIQDLPAKSIVLLRPAKDPADESSLIVAEAKRWAWRRLVLVTSGFHMGRAMRLFRQAAHREGISLSVIPFPADPLIYERWPPASKSLVPSISGREFSTRALRELFGQVFESRTAIPQVLLGRRAH
jgi:uncharacterized SAM-binding protein YcdF (DUF218 family)